MTYSRHSPPEGLAGWPRLIWPLVYLQLIALKAWMRQQYGPGVPYWYTISHWGTVSLGRMPMDAAWSYSAHGVYIPAAYDVRLTNPSPRLALALAEEARAGVPGPEGEVQLYTACTPARMHRYDSS